MKRFFFRYVVLTWLPHKNQVRDIERKKKQQHTCMFWSWCILAVNIISNKKRSSISIQTYANKGTDFGQSSDRMINDEDRAICNPWWTENKYSVSSVMNYAENIIGFEALFTLLNLIGFTSMRIESQQHFHQIYFVSIFELDSIVAIEWISYIFSIHLLTAMLKPIQINAEH